MKHSKPTLHGSSPFAAAAALFLALAAVPAAFAQTTAFTYQGRLDDNGNAATGLYDFEFTIQDSDAKPVGKPLDLPGTPVAAGVFTAVLDFGAGVFTGADRWIQIGVRTNGAATPYVAILPRTRVTSTPYAQTAGTALAFAGKIADAQLPASVARLGVDGQAFPGFTSFGTLGVGNATAQFPLTIRATLVDNNDYLGFQSTDGITRWHVTGVGGGLNFVESGVADFRLFLAPGGNVGIGTGAPASTLDVKGSIGGTSLSIDGPVSAKSLVSSGAIVGSSIVTGGTVTAGAITSAGLLTAGSILAAGQVAAGSIVANGEVTCTAVNITSDRNAKERFEAVNPREVLEKVARLPITRWQYKSESGARHLGPMAQDFHAAFGLGHDERHIATVDEDGVALAAIQGLNEKVDAKDAEIARLKSENTALSGRLSAIERALGLSADSRSAH